MDPFDIAIVGGGPAGSTAAWLLGGCGFRVTLLEASPTARRKPCGEYLAPRGVAVLERAGLAQALAAADAQPLRAVAMRCGTSSTIAPYAPVLAWSPEAACGVGVRRERLDGALLRAAATRAEVRCGVRVLGLERTATGHRLTLEDGSSLEAGVVVGADGRGSAVRRLAGLDQPPVRRRFALATRASGVQHDIMVEMHLGPLGQIGLCPLGDGEVNLNLLLSPASTVLLRRMPPARLMAAALAATPSLSGRLHGLQLGDVLATGSLPRGCTAAGAPGIALIGDAAGFCDPFTGEGMSLALRSAEMLAGALAAHRGTDGYASDFQRAVTRRRRIGEGLQGLLARRRASEGVVATLARLPLLNRLLVADAAGYRRTVA